MANFSNPENELVLMARLQMAAAFANKAHHDLQEALKRLVLFESTNHLLREALNAAEDEVDFLRRYLPPDDAVSAMAEREQEQIKRRERREKR